MHRKSLKQLAEDLQRKKYSSQELTQFFLKRIKKYDKKLNSFITITEEMALQQAKLADTTIAKKQNTPLTGIPIAHKDLFCTKDIKTTCASKMLENFIPPYEATVTDNLKKAGMVLLGKTNMDEFAMGSTNEKSIFGSCHNPWNLTRTPGGSSGGSAAAIAARIIPAATGSDTGGSIRQPAALCGISALRPTYGLISRYGMVDFSSSLDTAGPMAASAEDLALLLNYMAGFDNKDATSVKLPKKNYLKLLNKPLKNLRIGLPKEYFDASLTSDVAIKIEAAITELKKLGAKIIEVSLPNSKYAAATYYVIAPIECSSNLSRFDGIRYGYSCTNAKSIAELYKCTRRDGFGKEVKRRILIGTYLLSTNYYSHYYLQAQKVRRLIANDFVQAFNNVDIILTATTPEPAFRSNAKKNQISRYLTDEYLIPSGLAGLPSLSIPIGFVGNLPVGMQLIGNYFKEAKLLNVAHQYQIQTAWHKAIPKGFVS